MITDRFEQVCLATRAASPLVGFERIGAEFEQLNSLVTRRACDGMPPAIREEECSLLASQIAGPTAINVNDARAIGFDNIVERELAQAPVALRLSHYCTAWESTIAHASHSSMPDRPVGPT